MRTSFSAIDTYTQCPQKYKFQEIDKIKAPKSREALFGTLVHGALEFMFSKSPLYPTLDEVLEYFRSEWPPLEKWNAESDFDSEKRKWTETDEKAYYDEGVRIIKNFFSKNPPWNFNVLELESRFEVPLTDEVTGEVHVLAGIMDRVDKTGEGTYEIIDYKTGRRMPSQETLESNLQLALYALGLQKRWPHIDAKNILLSLYFLKHGEKLSIQAGEEMIERARRTLLSRIRDILDRIRKGKEFEPVPSALCDWCSFRPLCPAWKHLYRKKEEEKTHSPDSIQDVLNRYFKAKENIETEKDESEKLLPEIKAYMEKEGLTRLFSDRGIITKQIREKWEYDIEKVKAILSPLGKWEEVFLFDEAALKKIVKEIPEPEREKINELRHVVKETVSYVAVRKEVAEDKESM